MIKRPADKEYAPFFAGYVALVTEPDVMGILGNQPAELAELAGQVSTERERFRYADGKWSIREVFGHLVDADRVFGHRAFCIGRGEQAALPGFEENQYVALSHYDERTLAELATEFTAVRRANLLFLSTLDDEAWARTGVANKNLVSVRALAFIMAGHVRHHFSMLRSRYGVSAGI
jgi:uncharacterized damage-inducible protein DinB